MQDVLLRRLAGSAAGADFRVGRNRRLATVLGTPDAPLRDEETDFRRSVEGHLEGPRDEDEGIGEDLRLGMGLPNVHLGVFRCEGVELACILRAGRLGAALGGDPGIERHTEKGDTGGGYELVVVAGKRRFAGSHGYRPSFPKL